VADNLNKGNCVLSYQNLEKESRELMRSKYEGVFSGGKNPKDNKL
jgi:hypothetical protein